MGWQDWETGREGGTMRHQYDALAILCLVCLLVAALVSVAQSVALALGH